MAEVLPAASSGGEGWAALVVPMVSCVGGDWVGIVVLSISDFGGWGWFVSSLAGCVGVGRVNELSIAA